MGTERTPLQKLLLLVIAGLILAILAVGVDILVQQSTLAGKTTSIEERAQRVERLAEGSPTPDPLVTPTPDPTKVAVSPPIQIEIPNISVFAEVVPVGINEQKQMEVPADARKVGWYSLGIQPGEIGGSIMTAHYDTTTGKPAIFYNLRRLNPGDLIYVKMENQEELLFQVQDVVSHPVRTFPTELIYGDIADKQLILITCDGVWNPIDRDYSKRLVVFATLWKNNTL